MTKTVDSSNLGYLIGKIRGSFWAKGDTSELAIDAAPTENSNNLVSSGGVFDAVNGQYIEAWDGASSPVAANIPAGVSVTYNGVTTTGSLAASASTKGKIYLVSDGNGQYDRYYTSYDGSTYSWAPMGSTAIDLRDYAHQADVDAIEEEIDGIENLKTTASQRTSDFPAYNKEATDGYFSGTGYNILVAGAARLEDTVINKIVLRVYKVTGAAYKAKLIAVQLSGSLPIHSVSEELTLPTPTDTFLQTEVTLNTPFTVPAGYALGIVADTNGVFRIRQEAGGTASYFRSVTYANMNAGVNAWPYAPSISAGYAAVEFYEAVAVFKDFATVPDIKGAVDASLSKRGIDSARTWTVGTISSVTGEVTADASAKLAFSDLIAVRPGEKLYIRRWAASNTPEVIVAQYDANGGFISTVTRTGTGSNYYYLYEYNVPGGVSLLRFSTYVDSSQSRDTTGLASISQEKSDIYPIEKILTEGLASLDWAAVSTGISDTHGRWLNGTPTTTLVSTKLIPSAGLQYIGAISGYSVTLMYYDGSLAYLGQHQFNGKFNRVLDAAYWDTDCEYLLVGIEKTGGTADLDESKIVAKFDLNAAMGDNGPRSLSFKEYYDREIDKGAFLNAAVINDWEHDKMAHGSRIVLGWEGNLYTAYYHSTTAENESSSVADGVVLARINPADLTKATRVSVLAKGDTVGAFTQKASVSPYDPDILKISDTQYRIFMWLEDANGAFLGWRDFNPQTMELAGTIGRCHLVDGQDFDQEMTVSAAGALADDYFSRAGGTTQIGTYLIMTTQFVQYGGYTYAYVWSLVPPSVTQASTAWAGMIVRTDDDGETWELVTMPDPAELSWTSHTAWEAGIEIVDGKVYVIFRDTPNVCPVAYYDIANDTWSDFENLVPMTLPYISQGQFLADPSRPEMLYYNGCLYAAQNIKTDASGVDANDVFRGMVCVWKLDTDLNVLDFRIFQNAFGVSYFSFAMGNGFGYFAFTEDRTAKHQTTTNYNKRNISVMPIDMGTLIW